LLPIAKSAAYSFVIIDVANLHSKISELRAIDCLLLLVYLGMQQNPKGLYHVLFNFPFLPENGLSEKFLSPIRFHSLLVFFEFCYFIVVFVVIKVCYDNPAYYFITARCTLVQSAVLRSHVVCLSVRPSVCLSVCDVGEL